MKLDEVLQLQVLRLKQLQTGVHGRLLDQLVEGSENPELRQMCAKVSTVLYEDLTNVCEVLDMSKRQFIEAAVSDALERAHELIERSGALTQGGL